MTESRAYLAALRILTRSDRSRADLARRLRRQEFPEDQIEEALERCLKFGYLDDRRLADNLTRHFTTSGRAVGRRLRFELKKRGIPDELAEAALATSARDTANERQIGELLQRRFAEFDPRSANPAARRRVLGFFQRRGYRPDEILSAFALRADVLDNDLNQDPPTASDVAEREDQS